MREVYPCPTAQSSRHWLSRLDHAATAFHRYWLLQTAVCFLGVLFLLDTPLAEALADNFRIEGPLVRIMVPLATFYLFTNTGYILGEYLIAYPLLQSHIQAIEDPTTQKTVESATRNYSLARFIAAVPNRWAQGTTISPWEYIPGAFGIMIAVSVFNFSNGHVRIFSL